MKTMIMLTLLITGLHHPFTQGQITITSYPRPLYVRIGATFTLSCDYNSYNFHSWVHPTLGEVTSSQGHLLLTNLREVHLATLEVNSANTEDQGVYVCRATTQNNIILNQTISALILDPVQITTESMLTYEARLCETAVLNCTALHHDSIIWSRLTHDQIPRVVTNSSDGRTSVLSDTGQLVISEAKLSDNGTYICVARNRVSNTEITAYLNIIDFQPPPVSENVTVTITNTCSTALLTFTWSPVTTDTLRPIQYQINATNCGMCSSKITNLTTTTCEVANPTPKEHLCIFVVHIIINRENVSEASSAVTVMLRVPDAPLVDCIPHYSYPGGNLTTIHCTLNPSSYTFANVTDLLPIFYTINYYHHDATNDTLCNLSTIPATHCENECTFTFNVSSSTCPQTANIKITAYAINILGSGPQSEPIVVESTNVYLNVNIYSSNHTVYVIPVQSQTENTTYTYKVLYQLGETHDDCGGSQDMPQENNTHTSMHNADTALLLQLPTPSQANFVLCFMLTVYIADSTTVVIKGNLDFNRANTNNDVMPSTTTASLIPPKHKSIEPGAEDNKILIAATTLCAIVIILTTLVIISLLVIVALRRRRRRRSGPSNQENNIYELDDAHCAPQISSTQNDSNQGTLIYADVITSSGFTNSQFSIFMDDDRVEYAEIENGHPTVTRATTKELPARNIARQTTKGDHGSYPLNLDNLLIQLQSQVTPKWYQFGQVLGIDNEVLDSYTGYSPEVCIIEVLDHWLRNHHTKPTWSDVAQALKEVELNEMAEKILREQVCIKQGDIA